MPESPVVNLLIVDRSRPDIEHIIKTLEGDGYQLELTQASDVETVRSTIDYQPLDLLLLRLGEDLPTVAEVRLMIVEARQDIPIIAVIDDEQRPLRKPPRLLDEGADNYIYLDDADHLVAVVRKELRHLQDRKREQSFEIRFKESENRSAALLDNIQEAIAYIHEGHVSLHILHSECFTYTKVLTKKDIKELYAKLAPEIKITNKAGEIKNYAELTETPLIGQKAKNFSQKTLDGKTIVLSDFEGKYLLIEFWASGCGPCRYSHKELRKLYKLYQPKGFEILGVSGDINKSDFENAVKKDSIMWTNVSDLKGSQNDAFLLYDISGLPTYILLDKKGTIIKNSAVEDFNIAIELKSLFSKNGFKSE